MERDAMYCLPDVLTESLVVSERAVVFLTENVVNVLHAPVIQELGRCLWLLTKD